MNKNNHEHHDHPQHDHSQHDHSQHDHSGHGALFKKRFWISLIFAVPVLFLSPLMGIDLPFQLSFAGSEWIVLVLSTVLFFYGGMPFIQGATGELKQKSPGMMTLISLGISVAYVYSLYAFVQNTLIADGTHVMDFFWELSTLIIIMLLGHWIEMEAISNAGNALKKMAELLPSKAAVVQDDLSIIEVALSEVKIGQKVQVKAGEKMPVDGVILYGNTSVNEALVTGEARSITKTVNDHVIGGSINGSGTIVVEVKGTGESGFLAQVMELVNAAQQDQSQTETLSHKVAGWLFYVALGVGALAFIAWLALTHDLNMALERLVTVLVIACPHALGLAIPLVVARSTSIGAHNGLLIKNRQAFESTDTIQKILMDKTGTLTEGNFKVTHYQSISSTDDDQEILRLFGALEQGSSHPLAIGILERIEELGLQPHQGEAIENMAGIGLRGTIKGRKYAIVNASYLNEQSLSFPKDLDSQLSAQGFSISYLLRDNEVIGVVAQGDEIKASSRSLIDHLSAQGIEPIMLTGDNQQAAEKVAAVLGIKTVHAQLRPHDKEQIIKEYQRNHYRIMMVGDGVNDAPSLVRADIGVAIGAGTDVAIDSADVVLVKSDPMDILNLLHLGKNTKRKMIQNLWWGAGYNILAIPVAAGVFASAGITLTPAVAAIIMSFSTLIVAINAVTLKLK